MTSYPLVSLTLATFRIAELGFLGVVVYTRVQTPRFCGHCSKCCDLDLLILGCLGLRISCCIVGIQYTPYISICCHTANTVQLKFTLRVRNAKKPQSSKKYNTTRQFNRGSKQKFWSCPLQFWSNTEATLDIISRAYRLIRFRCQQALSRENNIKI